MTSLNISFVINALKSQGVAYELNQASYVEADIASVHIDSRRVKPSSLFVAFPGQHVDGHDYILQAKANGAVVALVNHYVNDEILQIKVDQAGVALATLANAYRKTLAAKIIAITGSAGKTTTKEMLAALLAGHSVESTDGNFNNELGVPLTLLNFSTEAKFCIVEMGAGQSGDIAYLMDIAEPDISLITNIGDAHIGRFGSRDNIAMAKTEIFLALGSGKLAVVNCDDNYSSLFKTRASHCEVLTFSSSEQTAAVRMVIDRCDLNGSRVSIFYQDKHVSMQLPLYAEHQLMNFLAATTVAIACGLPLLEIQVASEKIILQADRQSVLTKNPDITVIDDSYNASPTAVIKAIDYLAEYKTDKKNYNLAAVLGEMAELGDYSQQYHEKIAAHIAEHQIDKVFLCGNATRFCLEILQSTDALLIQADTVEQLIPQVLQHISPNDIVLVKGSRSQHLEKMVNALLEHNFSENTPCY